MSRPWYEHSTTELIAELATSPGGLNQQVATARLEQYGPNEIEFRKIPAWLRFLRQFNDPMVIILLVTALVTATLTALGSHMLPDTIVILESTASGASGDYYDRYQRAITFEEFKAGQNGYIKVFYPWFSFRDSRTDPAGEAITSPADYTSFEKEYAEKWELDLWQMAWMRMTLRDECNGNFDKFQEDYPSDEFSAFLRSGRGREVVEDCR